MFTQLMEQLKARLVGGETPLLELNVNVCRHLQFSFQRIYAFKQALVLAFELQDFLLKQIDVRLLLVAHLLDLCDVLSLLGARLFEHCDRFCLLFANLVIRLVLLVGPAELLAKHLDVTLDFLRDAALSVDLDIQRAQVVQLHELLLQIALVL